ncbi:hypothetical protein IWW39_003873 [Coemansia spiralis]|uniref:Uncharacterized protein n=1 Tax=Coemansia spiralis TaxID=417178 RepID=A0A9W8GD30_9FUNG|nr:hypothetical protein IWW39_003873 [Coemansia spiralis]
MTISPRYLSAFQFLPPHIVHRIVDHVACSSRLYYSSVTLDSPEGIELQMPLLWVCHNFRDFVYRRCCEQSQLYLSNVPGEMVLSRHSWPKRLPKIDHETNRFAKKLFISLCVRDVYSGELLQRLSSPPYEGCAFPLVHDISFWVYSGDELGPTEEYPPNTAANIAAFVQRIKEMAPRVRDANVANDIELRRLLWRKDAYIMDLARRLYDIIGRTSISYHVGQPIAILDLESASSLVHLKCNTHKQGDEILSLIRRNAQTLQTMDVYPHGPLDFGELFRDPDDGRYLEYPCLHKLGLFLLEGFVEPKLLTPTNFVPFPCLRLLHLEGDYPFGDDVVFRGNMSTLEYLSLTISPMLVEVLGRYKVFTPTSHPKLGCVMIDKVTHLVGRAFDSADEYVWFILSIAPGASVRAMPDLSIYGWNYSSALSMFCDYTSIQVLHLVDTSISFLGAIALIKALPLLSDMLTDAPTLGELSEDFLEYELPDYLRTTYAPMGRRFRCLRVYYDDCNYTELVTCMLLLALICPNFDYVVVPDSDCGYFMGLMRKKINGPLFSSYAPRLRRLLFNGWNGKQG